jgi:cell division protein FtsW
MGRLRKRSDYLIAFLVLGLAIVGIILIYSAGVVIAEKFYKNPYYFILRQLLAFVIGSLLMVVAAQIDFSFWRKNAFYVLILALLFMLPLAFHLVKPISGVYRWYDLGPFAFQPSEFLKIAILVYFAALFEKEERARNFYSGTLPFFLIILINAFLIIREPDLGSLIVIFLSALVLFLLAGANFLYLSLAGLLVGLAALVFTFSAPYRLNRVKAFLNPNADVLGIGYHSNQALIAIGTGGLFGKGFGQSVQKHFYLPEPHTDSIFAILVEELGSLPAAFIVLAFLFLFWRGFRAALRCEERFGYLLAAGLSTLLLIEAFINLSAMMRLLPLTGITLPFISYGGSNLIFSFLAVGIILNVSKHAK